MVSKALEKLKISLKQIQNILMQLLIYPLILSEPYMSYDVV